MTNQIRIPNERRGFAWVLALIAISGAASGACWWAAGSSLGLFLGGLFVVTFLGPVGVLGMESLRGAIAGMAGVLGPVAIFWLIPVMKGVDTFGQWGLAVVVLIAYCGAMSGVVLVLERVGWPVVFAGALGIVLGLAWLTWPVWLAAGLVKSGHGGVIRELVAVSPGLTINGVLTNEPAWTERSLAYHLTDLNQDVPIQLPVNGIKCAGVHGMIGLGLWSLSMVRRRKSESPGVLKSSAIR